LSRPKKKWIHVNQAVIKRNRKTGSREPVITCKTYDSNTYGHTVVIYDKDGIEVARVVYSPDKPLGCGAHVWLETTARVEVLGAADPSKTDTKDEIPCYIGHGKRQVQEVL
jgi:hypothetical protein